MEKIPQSLDYCANVPAKWRNECIDRQFGIPAKFEYTSLSEDDCKMGGFKWNDYTGCSSECSVKNKSFNSATKKCEWDAGFEPDDEDDMVMAEPAKPMAPTPRRSP